MTRRSTTLQKAWQDDYNRVDRHGDLGNQPRFDSRRWLRMISDASGRVVDRAGITLVSVGSIMSNRTWACVPCGKTFRRPRTVEELACPECREACEFVHWKMRVPPAKHRKQWLDFWRRYRAEKLALAAYFGGTLTADMQLELLNMNLAVNTCLPTPEQLSQKKWDRQKRRRDGG